MVIYMKQNEEKIKEKMMSDLADSMPKLRRRLKISQTDLGEKVGLSRQTISAVERKTTPLTWNNYLAIMMFFATNSDDVFYFPRRNGYKHIEEFMKFMQVSERIGGKNDDTNS